MLANRLPVQPLPQLSGTGTKWRFNYYMGEQILDTLETVKFALVGAIEQTVAVVETLTDDTNCNRFGSIKCQT